MATPLGTITTISGSIQKTDNLVVRNIYLQPTSNQYISTNYTLFSDGMGGTYWSTISTLSITAFDSITGDTATIYANQKHNNFSIKSGSGMGQVNTDLNTITLFSKGFQGFSTSTGEVNAFNSNYLNPILYLSSTSGIDIISHQDINAIEFNMSSTHGQQLELLNESLTSTFAGLGNVYISSINSIPEIVVLSTTISYSASTVSTILQPTIDATIQSTIEGLGSFGYVSSVGDIPDVLQYLQSEIEYITNVAFPSTLSSINNYSSIVLFSDISVFTLVSTGLSLGLSTVAANNGQSQGNIATQIIPSTIQGLGTFGYISTAVNFSSIRTSTVNFTDVWSGCNNPMFVSTNRLYFNSTIIAGTNVLPLQFFTL
jgi:hypothetical protein